MPPKKQPVDASKLADALQGLNLDQSGTSSSSGDSNTTGEINPTGLTQFFKLSDSEKSDSEDDECEDSENYDTESSRGALSGEGGFEVIKDVKEKEEKEEKGEGDEMGGEGDLCDSVSSSGSQFVGTSVGYFEAV